MTDHVDFVSLRGIARLTAMDAREAQGIEARRAGTTKIGAVEDESPVAECDAPNSGVTRQQQRNGK